MTFLDFFQEGLEFGFTRPKHRIRIIHPDDRSVGRDFDDTHVVDGNELFFFGFGRTGHPAQLLIQAEVVLVGNGGHGRGFLFDGDPFLGFQGLMQPIREDTSLHHTTCEGIDDDDLVFIDNVVHIVSHDVVGAKSLV